MGLIDNIYIINLDKDKERYTQVSNECKKITFKKPIRISGIYGKHLSNNDLQNAASPFYSKYGTKSAIGCAMSHMKAWKTMIQNNDNSALFLEDDAIINDNFLINFSKIDIPDDYNIIYLGCIGGCNIDKNYTFETPITKMVVGYDNIKNVQKVNDNVFIPSFPLALHGYILSKNGATILLQKMEQDKIKFHIDVQILTYIKDIQSYAIYPQLIHQRDVSINTSNNILSTYPVCITKNLTYTDANNIPFNYKLNISAYNIYGYDINGITIISIIIGLILGLYQIKPNKILLGFIIFTIIEYYSYHHTITLFGINTIFTCIIIFISYFLSLNIKKLIIN